MDKWIVGRSEGCDVIVNFPTVSRQHVILREAGEDISLCDLSSTGGTHVVQDGTWTPVQRARISPDEPIRLGDYKTTARALLGAAGFGMLDNAGNEFDTKSPRHRSD
ncbi:MAG TPA: FHA domain-containing protein [Alphaproteobacteria bacterium]|nr:FHA domain-containing protein [Alphaproteobacteria bacterium]